MLEFLLWWMGIEVQGGIVRRVITRNAVHGKEKLAVVVQHTAVSSLMECTTLYSISHP